jgi:hypothetical protein
MIWVSSIQGNLNHHAIAKYIYSLHRLPAEQASDKIPLLRSLFARRISSQCQLYYPLSLQEFHHELRLVSI